MSQESGRYLSVAALLLAGLLGALTARACRRAQLRGEPGSDAIVWAGLALVFLLFALIKSTRVAEGLGAWLRVLARQHFLYANRRPYQVFATATVTLIVVVVLVIAIVSLWDYFKRYRLAVGFASLAVGSGVVRFISLHEVDAWNRAMPWMRVVVELAAAAGASVVAVVRLRQLRKSRSDP